MLKGHSERHESVGGREQQISRFYWFVKRNSKHLCLQGHSSLPYMTLKPLRTASSSTFHHIGCAINVHTIIKSGLIFGGQNLSNRHAVFFLLVDPMDKNHKDPDTIDLNAPRLEQYMHKAWKKHQNTVCWVDKICSKERTIKHDRTQSSFTTHSQPIASRRLSANLTTTCFCSKTASDTHTQSVLHVHDTRKTIPQMTRFLDAKVCNNLATDEIDDHRIQSDYKCKSEFEKPEGKKFTFGIAGETEPQDARHQWQRDHQDPEHLPHSAHEPQHVNGALVIPCAHSPVVSFLSSWIAHNIVAQVWLVRVISCPYMKWALLLDCELSINSIQLPVFSHSSSISCTSFRISLEKRWNHLTIPSYSPQVMNMEIYVESFTEPTVLWATVPRGRGVRWHRTWGYASRSTPSSCLSFSARRLVCRSVVVVRVRANGVANIFVFRSNFDPIMYLWMMTSWNFIL